MEISSSNLSLKMNLKIWQNSKGLENSKMCVVKMTQGGAVAAPVAGQILGEVLPYLELQEDNEETKVSNTIVTVPDIKYKTLKQAEEILKESGLNMKYDDENKDINKEETIISSQIPSSGVTVNANSTILVTLDK